MPDFTYTSSELMCINAARLLRDGDTVFVGVGLPNLACNLARRTHAPNLQLIYEAGVIGARPARLPLSIGDPTLVSGAASVCGMFDIFSQYLQRGNIDVGFLGGAQIDAFGNLNSTVIGDHAHPKVRFPGSGGANDFASLCWQTLVLTQHDRRRFVAQLDFLTTPGYLTGPGAREAAGLPAGTGPYKVITDLAVLGFHESSKRMQVESLHPGSSLAQVQEQTSFELLHAPQMGETSPPSAGELQILREEVDPRGYILGR